MALWRRFDFESKPEKQDAATAPASNFMYQIETYGRRHRPRSEQDAHALGNPITRSIMERHSLCAPTIGRRNRLRKVKDSRPTFRGWSVSSLALRNLERIQAVAGNTAKPASNISPAIADTHQIFDKSANGVDRQWYT
jgi:hypothetical protein